MNLRLPPPADAIDLFRSSAGLPLVVPPGSYLLRKRQGTILLETVVCPYGSCARRAHAGGGCLWMVRWT